MSAFDLFSFKSVADTAAVLPASAARSESSRGDASARSFRDELSGVDQPRSAQANPQRAATTKQTPRDTEVAVEQPAETDTTASSELSPDDADVFAQDVEPAGEAVEVGGTASESVAVITDDDEAGGGSPVADLVLELITAFENVLQNNPLLQPTAAGEGVAVAGETESAPLAFPGLTALFEALGVVSPITAANGSQGLTPATNTPPPITGVTLGPTLSSTTTSAAATADASTLTVAGENTGAQSQAEGGDTPGGQNNPNNQAAHTATLKTSETGSLAANTSPASALPSFDAAASNTATQPVTPLVNSNQAGTDVSARLTPTTLADPNATNDALNTARLTRGLGNAVNQQGGTVTLRLTPPDLGTVRIQLNLQGTNVSAEFHAETSSGQRLLTQQLGQLRTSLEAQGLNVEKLGVQAMSSSSNSSGLQQQSNNDPSQSQSQAGGDGRSRGQYSGQSSQQNPGRDNPESRSFTQLFEPDPSLASADA